MDDLLFCPMCHNQLRTIHLDNKFLHPIKKLANYAERICSQGHNHIISLWADKQTKQIDMIKISLNSNHTKFVQLDFVNNKSQIILAKNYSYEVINIDRLIVPDFPDIVELKKTVSLYVAFN